MTAEHSHDHGHSHAPGVDPDELSTVPKFDPGTRVVLREAAPERYKRRPEYAEGAVGVVDHLHGAYVPPAAQDDQADEEAYEYLYSVEFAHTEIWDDHPESNGSIHIDVWETALEQA